MKYANIIKKKLKDIDSTTSHKFNSSQCTNHINKDKRLSYKLLHRYIYIHSQLFLLNHILTKFIPEWMTPCYKNWSNSNSLDMQTVQCNVMRYSIFKACGLKPTFHYLWLAVLNIPWSYWTPLICIFQYYCSLSIDLWLFQCTINVHVQRCMRNRQFRQKLDGSKFMLLQSHFQESVRVIEKHAFKQMTGWYYVYMSHTRRTFSARNTLAV